MKQVFYSRKFNGLSECTYFYEETVDSFEAMRKIQHVVQRSVVLFKQIIAADI